MRKTYEPDSRFIERLEWQLASECRRRERIRASGRITVPRRAVTVAVMTGILLAGVAATKAADYIKDSWRKKIEMARVETDVELKKVRLESLLELAARTEDLFANGLVREEESLATKTGVELAALDLERSQMNLDEVRASGLPPRGELHAPLADGRDFVSERLTIEVKSLQADLEILAKHWERSKRLADQALVPADEPGRIETEIGARKAMIDGVLKRLDLRRRYVAGEITAREVEIEARMTVAEGNLGRARAKADFLKKELDHLADLEAKGMVTPMETRQLRYGLDAAMAELKLATLEIEVLRKVKQGR